MDSRKSSIGPRKDSEMLSKESLKQADVKLWERLTRLMAETQVRFPNNPIPPATANAYLEDWMEMVLEFGEGNLSLGVIEARKNSEFFPNPKSIREAIYEIRERNRPEYDDLAIRQINAWEKEKAENPERFISPGEYASFRERIRTAVNTMTVDAKVQQAEDERDAKREAAEENLRLQKEFLEWKEKKGNHADSSQSVHPTNGDSPQVRADDAATRLSDSRRASARPAGDEE
jgi:hypothetical protein